MLALKKKMEAKSAAATQPAAPSTAAEGQTKQTSGQFQLSKQPSKDLADLRAKTTATTGVFGLAKKGGKGSAAGQKSAAELRAQKGTRGSLDDFFAFAFFGPFSCANRLLT